MEGPAARSGHWIPWAIIAFFAVFMLLLSIFAWIAFHTYPGEATKDAYNKGLAYNAAIASAEAQTKLGWKTMLQIKPNGKTLDIDFILQDASGKAIDDAQVVVHCIRPTQAGHDAQVTLHSDKGRYHGNVELDWPGAWDVRVTATRGADNYQQSKNIVLQ